MMMSIIRGAREFANCRVRLAIPAAAIATLAFTGAPTSAQTLEEALTKAYETNPALLAARAQLRSVDERVAQALSGWRPTVTLNGDAAIEREDNDPPGSPSTTQPFGGSLRIDQNVFRGGRTVAATRRAESDVGSQRARLSAVEQNVLLGAATAHMDVVRDSAIVDLNQNNIRVLGRQLDATRDRFRVGEVTRTDVAQAESRASRGRADLIRAQGALEQSRAAYRNVVGEQPGKLEPGKAPPDLVTSEHTAVERAEGQNFAVVEARFAEESARHRVREVLGELYPLVTLTGQVSASEERITDNSSERGASITARVTVPLYQAGAVSARVREAKQVAAQRRDELQQSVRTAAEDAARAWEALQTARAQIQAFSDEIRAAQIALDGVQQEALVGSRTVLDVLDAEQELFDARVNLVSALRDEVVAAYRLRQTTGDLTAEQLGLRVTAYDPAANYERVRGKWFGTSVQQ